MKIRAMSFDDLERVAKIHTRSWQWAYKDILDQNFLDSLRWEDRLVRWQKGFQEQPALNRYVVTESGLVNGFAVMGENRQESLLPGADCELWAIYIDPDQCRTGAGSLLLNYAKQVFQSQSKTSMCVWVLAENFLARNFYEKMGGKLLDIAKKIELAKGNHQEVSYLFNL